MMNRLNDERMGAVDCVHRIDTPLMALFDDLVLLAFEIGLGANDFRHQTVARFVKMFQFQRYLAVVPVAATNAQPLLAMAALEESGVLFAIVAFQRRCHGVGRQGEFASMDDGARPEEALLGEYFVSCK